MYNSSFMPSTVQMAVEIRLIAVSKFSTHQISLLSTYCWVLIIFGLKVSDELKSLLSLGTTLSNVYVGATSTSYDYYHGFSLMQPHLRIRVLK